MQSKPSTSVASSSRGRWRFRCGLVDHDTHCLLAHNLSCFRRWGLTGINLGLALPSPHFLGADTRTPG
jgi:hypothetical protein